MSLIQKLESGYLQFLRVVFLLFATIAIIIAFILGGRYLMEHDAQAIPVKDDIKISLADYKPSDDLTTKSDSTGKSNTAAEKTKDPLFEEFSGALKKLGTAAIPDFVLNLEAVNNIFRGIEKNPELGRPFLTQFVGILNTASTNPAIVVRLKKDVGDEFNAILEHSQREYKAQANRIANQRQQAESDALSKQQQAMWSLYAAGVLFLGFVGLILLIVLLKIERNLRHHTLVPAPQGSTN